MDILGLSHVAFNCCDIKRASAVFEFFEYQLRFDEPDLLNNPAKQGYLDNYNSKHHIRAFAKPGYMSIELLNHFSNTKNSSSALLPIFFGPNPFPAWTKINHVQNSSDAALQLVINRSLDVKCHTYYDDSLSTKLLWAPTSSARSGIYAFALLTRDSSSVIDQLTRLRFRLSSNNVWSFLSPIASLQARIIVFQQDDSDDLQSVNLDFNGASCFAFMAKNCSVDGVNSISSSPVHHFSLTISSMPLNIFLARSPLGILEFIEPIR